MRQLPVLLEGVLIRALIRRGKQRLLPGPGLLRFGFDHGCFFLGNGNKLDVLPITGRDTMYVRDQAFVLVLVIEGSGPQGRFEVLLVEDLASSVRGRFSYNIRTSGQLEGVLAIARRHEQPDLVGLLDLLTDVRFPVVKRTSATHFHI